MTDKTRFPLAWPHGWPRVTQRIPARFTSHGRGITISAAIDRLEQELDRLRATEPLLSSNLKLSLSGVPYSGQAEPKDCAVAVYFKLKGRDRVLACDRYTSASGNIAAIAAHIDALRRIERYGVGTIEQAFAGYTALPPPGADNRPPWREIFGIHPTAAITPADINLVYRARAKAAATNEAQLLTLNLARDAALQELTGA
jgi:hypothetical protein